MHGGIDKLLEAIRQRALVRSGRLYGQVECSGSHAVQPCDLGCFVCNFVSVRPCADCGAAV